MNTAYRLAYKACDRYALNLTCVDIRYACDARRRPGLFPLTRRMHAMFVRTVEYVTLVLVIEKMHKLECFLIINAALTGKRK
jgi:hypothetical protein